MFKAIWNNFYTSVVRNASSSLKGAIIGVCIVGALLCIIGAFKGGKEGKPIKNWFLFWLGVMFTVVLIAYIIMLQI